MAHDVVIRNGTLIDGTGAPRRIADIAIDDGRISAVGEVPGQARTEIDATGLVVTPGFVDMHTHYDAQVTWDPYITPSGWHGVTTVVMGNCGVGFAPAKAERRDWLIGVMEGVEDIPGAALSDGIEWEWETFPEYLDALEGRRWVADVGTQVPHSALRAWVMGDRSDDGIEATADERAAMKALTAEGLRAGALGFSTSRTPLHRSIDGDLIPGTTADVAEILDIADGMAEAGHGVFEVALHHVDVPDSFWWLREVAERTECPAVFNFNIPDTAPELWREILRLLEQADADGVEVYGQVPGRAVGILMSWDGTVNPFVGRPSFEALSGLSSQERRAALLEPETRAAILAERSQDRRAIVRFVADTHERMWPFVGETDYEPAPEDSLLARAGGDRTRAEAMAYDHLCSGDGTGMIYFPFLTYAAGSLDPLHELHRHPRTRMGLADGGAHCGTIVDGGMPTFMVTHWTRDRTRGDLLSLEHVIHRQTQQTAEFYGLHDRGVLAPGMRADVNVIDIDALSVDAPEMAWDLPTGAARYIQKARGYRYTICAGEITVQGDEFTGALPGRLIRGPQIA